MHNLFEYCVGALGVFIISNLLRYKLVDLIFRKKFVTHSSTVGCVIITGTSKGLGRAASIHLAERFPSLTFYCGVRREEDGITGYTNIISIVLDVTKNEDVVDAIRKVECSGLPLVAIVNNAGVCKRGTMEFQDVDSFRWQYEVNVFGTHKMTTAALPLLREAKGRVIIISSFVGRTRSFPRMAAYAGSKRSIEALGDVLRMEVEPCGVSVSMIEPGFLSTEMVERETEDEDKVGDWDNEETQAYPHLYNEGRRDENKFILNCAGKMSETCEAIEHAMFDEYPKTRYITSMLGPVPAWMFVIISRIVLSDRMEDRFINGGGVSILMTLKTVKDKFDEIIKPAIRTIRDKYNDKICPALKVARGKFCSIMSTEREDRSHQYTTIV